MIIKETKHKNFNHNYLIGDCHNMAIALHRKLKLPMVSFFLKIELPEKEWYGDGENDKFLFEHAHAAVLLNKDMIIDVRGIIKLDNEEKNNFLFMTDTEAPIEMASFENEEYLSSNYADFDEDLIQEAMKFSETLNIKSIVSEFNNKIRIKRRI